MSIHIPIDMFIHMSIHIPAHMHVHMRDRDGQSHRATQLVLVHMSINMSVHMYMPIECSINIQEPQSGTACCASMSGVTTIGGLYTVSIHMYVHVDTHAHTRLY